MHSLSPLSLEGLQLVRIVVLCAQTRLLQVPSAHAHSANGQSGH